MALRDKIKIRMALRSETAQASEGIEVNIKIALRDARTVQRQKCLRRAGESIEQFNSKLANIAKKWPVSVLRGLDAADAL
ncbi:MAG: hypothetical protein NVSMB1_22990 [Polyangiales bacterium]